MATPEGITAIVLGEKFYRNTFEGALVSWTPGGLELAVSFDKPSQDEVDGFNDGAFEIGLRVANDIPWVCFRIFKFVRQPKGFQATPQVARIVLPWHECPFHAARVDPDYMREIGNFALEAAEEDELRIAVNAVLVEFPTGEVLAIRRFSLSPYFSRNLLSAVLTTSAAHTPETYDQAVTDVFNQFPVEAIGESTRIRCRSGD